MKLLLDTHSHTIASGHAYSTVTELAMSANQKGLKLLCITDHAPSMPGTCHQMHFRNFKVIDKFIHGVEIFMGAELNIINYDGEVDLPVNILSKLDMCIASFHPVCLKIGTIEENTNSILEVMENKYVNVIGHPEDGKIPVDFELIVKKAKETNTLIEINNSSLKPASNRINTHENIKKLLILCKEEKAYITIGSDAHFHTQIGESNLALDIIKESNFPEELIINTNVEKFKDFIKSKRN